MQTTLTSKRGLGHVAKDLFQLRKRIGNVNLDTPIDRVFRRSQELCLVGMTGELRNSGQVTKTKSSNGTTYTISYDAAYAAFAHDLDYNQFGKKIHHGAEFNSYWSDKIAAPRDVTFTNPAGVLITIPAAFFFNRSPEETSHFLDQAFDEFEPTLYEKTKSWISNLIDKVLK